VSEHDHYRSLFEGSQASLADMAARQAQALSRVGRLRSAIVAVLRKNFMELSAQAEANLGGRLSEVDDEILLAYLDAFTAAASRGDQRATIQALKEAVMALSIPLRGDEPLVWVEQIHQHRQQSRPSAAKPDATAHGADEPTVAAGRVRPPLITGGDPAGDDVFADRDDEPVTAAANQPLPVDDYWKWDDSTPLGDLFDDVDEPQNPAQDEAPRRWGNDLGTIAADEERWTPSPIAPGSTPRTGPAPTPAVALEPEETIRPAGPTAASPTARPSSAPPTTPSVVQQGAAPAAAGSEQGEEPVVKPAKKSTKRQPRRRATAPGETAAEPVTIDETAPSTAPPVAPPAAPVVPIAPLATAATTDQQVRVTEPSAAATGEDLSALFEDVPSTETPGANTFVAPPMRPELFTPSAPKRRRGARAKASTPITEIPLTEGVAPQELNDGMRTALLAAASIPRPVFTRDLIGVAGSLAMVDAWEAECRADVSSSPVRFVAPKSRHRLRGHLVAVEPAVVRPGDWWYQAVQRYRAGRLYELAVLLHRVGDEIVSFTLEDQLAVFHLNTPRGLVGMVVVLDPRPIVGGASYEELVTHLEKLLSERLTMIAVLTASAEPGSLENLISHVEDLAGRRQWQPTAPVIAARSWEYADDRGTSAVMVLGQS
jgi:hypothetical protein